MNLTSMISVDSVEYFFNECGSVCIHGFPNDRHESVPVYSPIFIECFLKCLEFKFLEEDTVLLKCFIKLLKSDNSRLLRIENNERAIDSPKIRQIFVLVEG